MTGMGTSCITTVTAFIVVNARHFGMRTFDLRLWAGPIAVLTVGLTLWRRYHARRLSGNDAPAAAPRAS
jgi:cytochrome c-type biogenesis protein CcmH/NrfF